MKNMKKFFAVLLTLVMVMGMTTVAFAAEADLSKHTYKAYQIFTGTQGENSAELGNIDWGSGIEGAAMLTALKADATLKSIFASCNTAKDVAEAMKEWTDGSENAKAFAQIAYKNVKGDGTTIANNGTLDAGYYLIVDQGIPAEEGKDSEKVDAYNLSLLQLTKKGEITIANKTDVPEVDKVIVEGEGDDALEVKLNEKGMGKTNTYKITGTLPTNFADYEEYYYWFKDTMSKGLTYNEDSLKVEVVNVVDGTTTATDVTAYFYKKDAVDSETGITTIDVAIKDLKALNLLEGVTIDKDSKIVVTYRATVNENAVIAGEGNPNDVDLEYSNNPDNNGNGTPSDNPPEENPSKPTTSHPTGTTPKDKVVTYVTELTIHKVDEKGNPLTGVEFTLKSDDMVKVNVKTGSKFVADENGTYYKLANETYTEQAPIDDEYEEGWDDSKEGAADHLKVKNNHADYDQSALGENPTMYALKSFEDTKYETATGTPLSVKATVDENGMVTFSGLGTGHYVLEETVTPNGYNTIAPVKFEITFENGKFAVGAYEEGDETYKSITLESDNTLATEIVNKKGTTLPETGGMGTRLFYMIGGLLVVAAGVLLITKRRMATK